MIWRWKSTSAPTSLASAVRIAGSSVRSIAGRAGQPCGAARKSATTSVASVAEPPFPNASSCPPRVEARAQRRGRGGQRVRALGQRLRAQRADLGGLHPDRRADVRDDRLEVGLLLAEERVEEARRPGVVHPPRGRGPRAGRGGRRTRAPAPTGGGSAVSTSSCRTNGSSSGGASSHSAPAPLAEADRQAAARRRGAQRGARLRLAVLGAEGDDDVLGRAQQRDLVRERPAAPGEPERGQRALADDHRMDELDGDVAHVRARRGRDADGHEPPAAREPLGHPVAQPRDPVRRAREERVAGGEPALERGGGDRLRHAGTCACIRAGSAASQSRNASSPSPVRALMTMCATPGWTASR